MRRVARDRHKNELGVTGLFVLFFMVALLGSLGLVIDLGLVRQERRELQNGADAAALALAQDCARGMCTNLASKAEPYADANAKDGASFVTSATQNIAAKTVTVETRTETLSGEPSLTTQFAQLVGGPSSSTVRATATAGWAAPGKARTIPITISFCEWNVLTESYLGTAVFPTAEKTIYFHDPTKNGLCPAGPAGKNFPSGFGILDNVSGSICGTDIITGNLAPSDPGSNAPKDPCTKEQFLYPPDVLIPVFDTVTGVPGNGGAYRIVGLATFRMTRLRLGNNNDWKTNPVPEGCGPNQRCIYGSFRQKLIPCPCGTTVGEDLGTLSVKLVA
jgi:Flp pilus assembly protein TadG